ncbi:MAG: hypothetical protein Q7R87_02585 [Nanoarchaeota archaeon]|nr:hypothetical protein [Nanoarchaeota archaeon]
MIINKEFLLFFMVGKHSEEINIAEFIDILRKNVIFIISTFMILMIIFSFVMLIWPKSYISESRVQLASIGIDPKTSSLFSPVEAKSILESGSVLESAVGKYNSLLEKNLTISQFKDKKLHVEIYKESVGRDEIAVDYLTIRVSSSSPEVSKEVNDEILTNFLDYVQPFYNRTLNVYREDLEGTKKLKSDLEKELESAKNLLSKLSSSSVQSGGASDILLLTQVQASYRGQIIGLFDRQIKIENALANSRRFKVISYPQLESKFSSPPVFLLTLASIVIIFLLSVSLAFIKEQYKSNLSLRH